MTLFNENDEKPKKKRLWSVTPEKGTVGTYNQIRNLNKNKLLTDEEFDQKFKENYSDIISDKEWEKRIQDEVDKFSVDYDISDLKINDITTLRSLAAAVLRLGDLELYMNNLMKREKSDENIYAIDKISGVMNKLRADVSSMSTDLRITRKARKGDHEANTLTFLEDLKTKAKEFYDKRTMLIFCPKCHMLLWQGWWLYPQFTSNKISMDCHRKLEDNTICNGHVEFSSKYLLERGGRNYTEIPESMK
jgi:hypothetical protein